MKKGLLIPTGIVVALFAIWELWLFPVWTIRYRLTIDVAVADEIKSGSGVIEMIWRNQSHYPLIEAPWGVEIHGEAIPVDLGPSGRLFALLVPPEAPRSGLVRRWGPLSPPMEAFSPNLGIGEMTGGVLFGLEWRRDVVDLAPPLLPMIVRFRDIDDPKTVEEVDPSDLASSIGADVRIIRATVQMAPAGFWPFNKFDAPFPKWLFGEPITTGIERQLPSWYVELLQAAKLRNRPQSLSRLLPGGAISLADRLSTYEFQRGVEP